MRHGIEGGRHGRVLLLGEAGPERDAVDGLLREDGFHVEAPADRPNAAQQALAALARGGFDLALCETSSLALRGVDPRSFVAASDAMVVLLSDHPVADEPDGVFDVLHAPVEPAALRLVVRRALEHKRRCDERRRLDSERRREAADLEARSAELATRSAEVDKRQSAQKKLRQFVVHDLKNQISVVKSNIAYVVEEGAALPHGETLRVAERAIDRALALTLGLLDVEHALLLHRSMQPLGPLLEEAAAEQAVLAREAGVAIVVGRSGVATIDADAALIGRVLANLVGNAISQAHARRVTLSASIDSSHRAIVSVEDDGLGMASALRRAPARSSDPDADLGLRFCHAAVGAHGGSLWIEERAPRGTAVRFRI